MEKGRTETENMMDWKQKTSPTYIALINGVYLKLLV